VTQSPAGWYPDPSPAQPGQPPLLRYWDGWGWTEHVQPFPYPPVAPPAYPGSAFPPGPTTPDGEVLSGWWRRAGAYVLDSLIVGVAASVFTLPLQLRLWQDMDDFLRRYQDQIVASAGPPDLGAFVREYVELMLPLITWSAIAGFVVWAVYSSLMLRFKGATVGKMALGIAVRLRDRPGQLPWSAILRRVLTQYGVALTAIVPVLYLALMWFPYLDGLWPLWDKKNQALHDKVAGTNVVVVG
jgi:uncharacterized RDD family membrane protein YckC